jgi:hypothetical protein
MTKSSKALVTKLIEEHHQPLFQQFIDEWRSPDKLFDRFLNEKEIVEDLPLSEVEIAKIKQRVVDGLWEKFSDFAWSYFCEERLWGLIQREIDEGYDADRDLGDHPLFQSLFATLSELAWIELNLRYPRWKEAA